MYKIAANRWQGLAAVGLLCLSTAFIDYSTSGLENPLSHLLFGIFLFLYLRRQETGKRLLWLALVAALAAVNRLDTLLLYLPALLVTWWQQANRRRATLQVALGFAPLVVWEVFSVIYYGFPFPNTFYAKTQNYVPLAQELWAGINYFLFTLFFDPITWLIILAGLGVVLWQRQAKGIVVAVGILLYLAYVVLIGGDFMGGRFLSLAYLGAVILLLLALFPMLSMRKHWALIPALVLISVLGSSPPFFLYAKGFQTARWNGVVDERMVYYTTNFVRIEDFHAFNADPNHNLLNQAAYLARTLWRGTAFRLEADHDWIDDGRQLRARAEREGKLFLPQGANGFTGYYAGPDVYILHGLALTDGLLARVPPIYNPNWRSGHFMRLIPAGYLELEAGSQAHLDDAALDAYYQNIRLLTQGPLLSAERWEAIWVLNTRDFADLVPGQITRFRFPGLQTVTLETNADDTEIELNLNFAGQGSAAQVEFSQLVRSSTMELALSAGDNFQLVYLDDNGEEVSTQVLLSEQAEGIETHQVIVPQRVATYGFGAIRIVPIRYYYTEADGSYMLASLWLGE